MSTEFDQLQAAWADLDRRVAAHDESLLQNARTTATTALRGRLRPAVFGQWAQAALGLALALLGGLVWPDATQPAIAASAIAIHLYGIAAILMAGATLANLARLDYASPVLELQARMLRIQRLQLIGSAVLGLAWWVLWVPLMLTLFAWMGGSYIAHIGGALQSMLLLCAAGFAVSLVGMAWAWRHARARQVLRRILLGERLYRVSQELDAMSTREHAGGAHDAGA